MTQQDARLLRRGDRITDGLDVYTVTGGWGRIGRGTYGYLKLLRPDGTTCYLDGIDLRAFRRDRSSLEGAR